MINVLIRVKKTGTINEGRIKDGGMCSHIPPCSRFKCLKAKL